MYFPSILEIHLLNNCYKIKLTNTSNPLPHMGSKELIAEVVMFSQKLRDLRKGKGYTLDELAFLYNKTFKKQGASLNKGTLSKYENNHQKPSMDTIIGLAQILQVSVDYLLGSSIDKTSKDSYEKIVSNVADSPKREDISDSVLTKIPLYTVPVSAGGGQWLNEGCEYDIISLRDIPNNADFSLRVRGDSMTPMYVDDDIIFVRTNIIVESGQIGVFFLNGEGYLKMLQGNKLVSLNENYKPVIINEYDSFFCVGRVIGKIKK